MSVSSSSVGTLAECSTSSSLTNSDYRDYSNSADCSSLEGSVSLPKRSASSSVCPRSGNRSIIVECDSLWCIEYSKDIFSYLRSIENTRRTIMYKSPQIHHRASLIDLMKRVAETEKLGRTTVHLAVYMLDVFMDTYKIIINKLDLVALVCVLIASKVEERDQNIPKICTLNSYTDDQFGRGDFKSLERMILNFFKWSLLVPTSATFLESFAYKAVTWDEIRSSKRWQEIIDTSRNPDHSVVREVSETSNGLVFEFLELTLTERRLVHVRPSLLSAACIAAARKTCHITPLWSERLKTLTEHTYDMIEEYVECLISLRDFHNRKKSEPEISIIKKTPDSGFLTESDSESHEDDDEYTSCSIPFKRQRLTY